MDNAVPSDLYAELKSVHGKVEERIKALSPLISAHYANAQAHSTITKHAEWLSCMSRTLQEVKAGGDVTTEELVRNMLGNIAKAMKQVEEWRKVQMAPTSSENVVNTGMSIHASLYRETETCVVRSLFWPTAHWGSPGGRGTLYSGHSESLGAR